MKNWVHHAATKVPGIHHATKENLREGQASAGGALPGWRFRRHLLAGTLKTGTRQHTGAPVFRCV